MGGARVIFGAIPFLNNTTVLFDWLYMHKEKFVILQAIGII